MKRKHPEVKDYDDSDTTASIDPARPLALKSLGLKLPPVALIKLLLAKSLRRLQPI